MSLPKLVLAVATACPCGVREPGVARRASNFLLLRQKKVTKEKATPSLRPLRWRCGANLRRVGCGVRRGTRFALARAARTTTVSQLTRHGRSDARATPQPPRRRRSQQGGGRPNIQQPNSQAAARAFAALGPISRAHAPRAARAGPSEAKARVDVRFAGSLLEAPGARRARGGACAEGHTRFVN